MTMPDRPSAIRVINLQGALISQVDGSCQKLHDMYYEPVRKAGSRSQALHSLVWHLMT